MAGLWGILAPLGFGASKQRTDDDFVDRLSHSYSTIMAMVFSIVVSTRQYVGEPIECWVPGHFTKNYVDYTSKICWVSNTYYLPFDEKIPGRGHAKKMISYYQWVPFILLIQALMFYFPCLIWRAFNSKSGIEVNNIVDAGKTLHDSDNKDKTMRYMVKQMDHYFKRFRDLRTGCCASSRRGVLSQCLIGQNNGNYLVVLYIAVKLLYLINAIGQLFLLNIFLGTDFNFYGISCLKSMILGEEWPGTSRFPRTTICDFEVRQMGNVHRHSVQCVLPINFFNERIFLFVWFWTVIVAAATALSFLQWAVLIISTTSHNRFIRRKLNILNIADEKVLVRKFVENYLRLDGIFVLRILGANAGDLVVSEFASLLWDNFRANRKLPDNLDITEVNSLV